MKDELFFTNDKIYFVEIVVNNLFSLASRQDYSKLMKIKNQIC